MVIQVTPQPTADVDTLATHYHDLLVRNLPTERVQFSPISWVRGS